MLNSKYAPIVALAVVGIIIVLLLGWFLALKPQLDETRAIAQREDEVRQNTQLVNDASSRLDNHQATLDGLTPLDEVMAVNAPSTWDMPSFRARVEAAVEDANVEIFAVSEEIVADVDGWEVEPRSLLSNQIATEFELGPVHSGAETQEYVPAVAPANDAGAVSDAISAVPIVISVAGTPQEGLRFFDLLADPSDPLFQIYDVTWEARPSDAAPIAGVSDPEDGDVILTFTGYLYMYNASLPIEDDGPLTPSSISGDSPFLEIDDAPDQPGAS